MLSLHTLTYSSKRGKLLKAKLEKAFFIKNKAAASKAYTTVTWTSYLDMQIPMSSIASKNASMTSRGP